jgi:hypothetical protein
MEITIDNIVICITFRKDEEIIFSLCQMLDNSEKYVIFDEKTDEIFTDILPEKDSLSFLVSCFCNCKIMHQRMTILPEIDRYNFVNLPLQEAFQIIDGGLNIDIY